MKHSFYNLAKENKKYISKLKKNIDKIIKSGFYISHKKVNEFEKKFSSFCGTKYSVAVGNGYDSIRLSLEVLKILNFCKEGDEILVPANSYIATILPVNSVNLKPVLVEPEDGYFTISPKEIKKKISKRTKAIIVTHLYGHVAAMPEITSLAKKYNLEIIEDCSQAHGSTYFGKKVGNWGGFGCFSLFPAKNLGAMSDAGVITTNKKIYNQILKSIRNYGEKSFTNYSDRKYLNSFKGLNSRMSEINASLLIDKLKDLNKFNRMRMNNANLYLKYLKNPLIRLPRVKKNTLPVWHHFIIMSKKRSQIKNNLKKYGIESKIIYPIPPHRQKAYREYSHLSLPLTEKIHNENLSLPVNWYHSKKLIMKVIKILNKIN